MHHDQEIALLEGAVDASQVDSPERAEALNGLAKALWRAALAASDEETLTSAVSTIQQAVAISRVNLPNSKLAGYLNNLGVFLLDLASISGDPSHIERSIAVLEEGAECSTPAVRSILLLSLGNSLRTSCEFKPNKSTLEKAISVFKDGLRSAPSPSGKPKLLNGLATSLLDRFNIDPDGDTDDLQQASDNAAEAVNESDDDHPDRAVFLDTYASVLGTIFSRQPSAEILQEAIDYGTMAVQLASQQQHPNTLRFTINLADSLREEHKVDSSGGALDFALNIVENALKELPGEPMVRNLGEWCRSVCLMYRFDRDGKKEDIEECVRILRSICDATPKENIRWVQYQTTLAEALIHHFDFSSSPDQLDQSVKILKDAATYNSSSHPNVEIALSVALVARFDLRGSLGDLQLAATAAKTAHDVLDECSSDYTLALMAYANALLRTSQETEDESMLDRAIDIYQDVVDRDCVWKHFRPGRLYALSYALQRRFVLNGSESDWKRSLAACTESLELSEGLRTRYIQLGQMGNVHLVRAQVDGGCLDLERAEHLNEAVRHLTAALELMPKSDSRTPLWINNLGLAYETLHRENPADVSSLEHALSRYQEAAGLETASAFQRIAAAYRAVSLLATRAELDIPRAEQFCTLAIRLLPTISPRFLQRQDLQHMTSMFSGLGSYLVAVLLAAGHTPSEAVQALEATRGIMSSLLMDTRTDITALEELDPDLAAEFKDITSILDSPTSDLSNPNGSQIKSRDPEARIKAAKAFEDVVQRIRELDGLADFLMAPTDEQLQATAKSSCHIIIVNLSSLRSDALVVQSDKIWSIRLPKLTIQEAADNANKFSAAIDAESTGEMDRIEANQIIRDILAWLWNVLVQPVLSELPQLPLATTTHPQQHRICWIPTGALTNLPIHAAGTNPTTPSTNAMDLIISSYAVTIKSLQHHTQKPPPPPPAPSSPTALLIAMQETPGQTDLPSSLKEVTTVQAILSPIIPSLKILTNPPTHHPPLSKPTLLSHLTPSLSILHLSCHGLSDQSNPSQSHLLLPDWQSPDPGPLTVSDIASRNLPAARLAYLSACHVAAGRDTSLLDEGIHLAAAFQLAGFPQVVGTLWQVSDARAMEVAGRMWRGVIDGGVVCFERVAEAVNGAVKGLREDTKRGEDVDMEEEEEDGVDMEFEDEPFLWAGFVVMGL